MTPKQFSSKTLSGLLEDVRHVIGETVQQQMAERKTNDLNVMFSNINGMTMTFIKHLIDATREAEDRVQNALDEVEGMNESEAMDYLKEKVRKMEEKVKEGV